MNSSRLAGLGAPAPAPPVIDVPPGGSKLIRVITRLNMGGAARHAILLTRYARVPRGASLLVTGEVERHEEDLLHLAQANGVRLVRISTLRNSAGLREDVASFIHLYRLFRRERPVIVDLHLTKARVLGGVAARLAGVPVVLETFHGTLFEGYYDRVRTTILVSIERLLARFMDGIIVVSESVAADLIARRVVPRDRTYVIPLGLDLEQIGAKSAPGKLRAILAMDDRSPLVGVVARLVPIKGLRSFIEAAAIIAQAEPDARFVIIGDGPERPALERQAEALGLAARLTLLGWRRDVEDLYPEIDVVVLPSKNEGTPASLIEAMAAGRAVVATRAGGVPDVVTDEVDGLVVPVGDPPALATAILQLLRDPQRRRQLGEAARQTALLRFSINRLVVDMERLYQSLLPDGGEGWPRRRPGPAARPADTRPTPPPRSNRLGWRVVSASWAMGILIESVWPVGAWFRPLEAGRHLVAFAVLTLLLRRVPLPLRSAVLLSFLYGLVMEIIQIPLPYRSGRLSDLLVNMVGIAAAGAVQWVVDATR